MRQKSEVTLREAAELALQALESIYDDEGDFCNAITALRAALDEEQNYVKKWISVEDNLPKEFQVVLALYDSGPHIVYRKERENIDDRWVDANSGHSLISPTHWMPLPEYEHVHKMESNPTIHQMETVEPVAYLWQHSETGRTRVVMPDQVVTVDSAWIVVGPLYTASPKREPLTEGDINDLSREMVKGNKSVNWLCRAIERAHGIGGEE